MVPRARYAPELNQPTCDHELVVLERGLIEDEVVADDEGQEAGRFHPHTRPAGALSGPEDGMLEPLEDRLRENLSFLRKAEAEASAEPVSAS